MLEGYVSLSDLFVASVHLLLTRIFSRSSDINREKLKLRAEELAVRREEAMIARINAEANAKQVQASIEASATTNRLILELITKLLDKK